jgi:hypothetical protein
MTEPTDPLSPRVVSFVRGHITSLLQLEALLLVFEAGQRSLSAQQLSKQMYVPESVLSQWLEGFTTAGLCEASDEGYRLPDSPPVYELLSEVADCYLRRRISLGRVVFESSRAEQRTSLSEAFRLRKDR